MPNNDFSQRSPSDDDGSGGRSNDGPSRPPRSRDVMRDPRRRGDARSIAPTTPKKIKPTKLRIIGGQMRGRGVVYMGDRTTRPMKDSIRETLFNILGRTIKQSIALDLFAGTGVLAIESLSRGSVSAVAIEKSGLAAKTIRASADAIGIGDELSVLTGDSFRISIARMNEVRVSHPTTPWVVYFCPPYALWVDDQARMFDLLVTTIRLAPPDSQIVTETDKFFDVETLPTGPAEGAFWDIRRKGNVTLAFLEVPPSKSASATQTPADTDTTAINEAGADSKNH